MLVHGAVAVVLLHLRSAPVVPTGTSARLHLGHLEPATASAASDGGADEVEPAWPEPLTVPEPPGEAPPPMPETTFEEADGDAFARAPFEMPVRTDVLPPADAGPTLASVEKRVRHRADAAAPAPRPSPSAPGPRPPAAASPSAASTQAPDGVGPLDPPRPFPSNARPRYPAEALAACAEGTVVLVVVVADDGRVVSVDVVEGSGHAALDAEAARVVATWRFEPATQGGRPVLATLRQRVHFRLPARRGRRRRPRARVRCSAAPSTA